MPNHVINIVTFSGDEKKIAEMLAAIQNDEHGLGTIDFNKIIPMPESLNITAGSQTSKGLEYYKGFVDVYTLMGTRKGLDLLNIPEESEKVFLRARTDIDEDTFNLGKAAFKNQLQYGATTWYDWCINNWGTKWNAYGYDEYTPTEVDTKDATITFQTAWSAPHPILAKLAEMYPELSFEHTWADEDIGQNCGQRVYNGGECTEIYYPEDDEAVQFANNAWGYDDIDEEMGEQNL